MYVSAVLEHNVQKIRSRVCAVNAALESSLYQERYPAAVVYMGMAEHHVFDFCRVERKLLIIESFLRLSALKLPAVQQDLVLFRCYEMAGSRHT